MEMDREPKMQLVTFDGQKTTSQFVTALELMRVQNTGKVIVTGSAVPSPSEWIEIAKRLSVSLPLPIPPENVAVIFQPVDETPEFRRIHLSKCVEDTSREHLPPLIPPYDPRATAKAKRANRRGRR